MLAEERKKVICEIVNRKKAVRVSELSKRLNITEATVCRDLDELQNEKKTAQDAWRCSGTLSGRD